MQTICAFTGPIRTATQENPNARPQARHPAGLTAGRRAACLLVKWCQHCDCLWLLLLLATLFANSAHAQGALTNGLMHTGTIAPAGDSDSWTFSANAGDNIVIRVGEITQTNFNPRLRLQNPSAVQQASASGTVAAEIAVTATNSGTFTVIVDDLNSTGTGTYRLTLAKTGSAVAVSVGDDGGPMTNGVMHTGTILPGDLDVWTFSANNGDNLIVRMGEITDTNLFYPWVRLYGPDGALLRSSANAVAAEVAMRATNSGTFIVVVGDDNGGLYGSGDYQLILAKTGAPFIVSPGDNGGPMTNGVVHTGTISLGDLDMWSFTANNGDNLIVRMGEITDTNLFYPWVRLYGPDGALLDSSANAAVVEVAVRATNSGTFIVVVGDDNGGLYGSGDYQLTLAKTGDPVSISAGDNGGPMTNGLAHTGTILLGDLDMWTFTANNGDNLIVRMGKITDTNTFYPWVRLFGPDGALLGSSANAAAVEVAVRATNSGTFIVVVGDGNGGLYGSGDYQLTLAKTGSSIEVSPGDEGGGLSDGVNPEGVITVGDLDAYAFTTCKGETINLKLDELTDTSGNFTPWLRLYGPGGALLGSVSGATTAQINVTATNGGTFIAIVSDGNGGLYGTGTYRLTGNGLSFEWRFCLPVISGTNVNLSSVGGISNTTYIVSTSTNVATSANLWTPLRTNQYDDLGVFSFTVTNLFKANEPRRFFRVVLP